MGLNKSRNMARANENRGAEETSEEGSDSESDLASILQYLIRSGQVRILGREQPFLGAYPRPPVTGAPNLDNFHKSEICRLTKKSCGILSRGLRPTSQSIPEMIRKREDGTLKDLGFSRAECCAIANAKLPTRMRVVDTYENKAFCGVYSHDGNRFLTASQDRMMRTYDSSNSGDFKELTQIQGRDIGWSVLDTAFSPDSSKIAYSSWSTCLHMVDVDGGESGRHTALPLFPTERRFCVFSLVFSHGGSEILCCANDGHLYIYDLESNDRSLRIEAHDDDVNTVAFADPTSQIIYSGADDGLCKVWDRRTLSEAYPSPVGVLAGHLDGITYIDSRGDGRHLISNSKDQSIKLWDIRMMSSKAAEENTRKAVNNNKWDYRWQTAPRKLVLRKTNIKGDTSVATYRGHSVLQTLIRCHFSPAFSTGQRYIVTGCAFGRVVRVLNSGDLDERSGAIQAAINLELHSEKIKYIDVKVSGLNGQLPNLDLVNLVLRMCSKERVRHSFANKEKIHNLPSYEQWERSLGTMISMLLSQASGVPDGNHGLFHRFGIEAVTMEGIAQKGNGHQVTLHHVGRVIEGLFRSINNLLERFHQSYFFYLLADTDRFVSIGLYMPCNGMLVAALFIRAFSLHVEMRLENEGYREEPIDANMSGTCGMLLVSLLVGSLADYVPTLSSVFSDHWMLKDRITIGYIVISILSVVTPFIVLSRYKQDRPGCVLHILSLVLVGTLLLAVGMYNFSIAFLSGLIVTPIVLLLAPSHNRVLRFFLWLLIHPLVLLLSVITFIKYYRGYDTVTVYEALGNSLLLASLDHQIYGSWTLRIVCLAYLSVWVALVPASTRSKPHKKTE